MSLLTNIVEYFKLDESSGNATGSVSSTVLTNNNTVGYAAAKINNGADFGTANTNKYLKYAGNLGINGGDVTLACWMKMRTEISTGRQAPIACGGGSNNVEYHIRYDYNAGSRRLSFVRDKNGVSEQQSDYTVTLGTSNWYHVALTYDGTNIRGYVNGSIVAGPTAASGNGSSALSQATTIGSWLDGANYLGSMYVDEAAIYSRALSGTEISQLYASGNGFTYPFVNYTLAALTGSFTLTGIALALLRRLKMSVSVGSFTLTGVSILISKVYKIVTAVGSFVLLGIDVMLRFNGWSFSQKSSTSWNTSSKSDSTWTFINRS